jgi:hypothetical protein
MIIRLAGFAAFEGNATRYAPGGGAAWSYVNGAWRPVNSSEVFMHATVLTTARFRAMFGDLPPIPWRCVEEKIGRNREVGAI